jgi:hypothetical protein
MQFARLAMQERLDDMVRLETPALSAARSARALLDAFPRAATTARAQQLNYNFYGWVAEVVI